MPLSEFHRAVTAKGKLESTQSKMINCTSDVSSFTPDQEFVELLWENGQIVMQGQSNRPKKISFPTAFPSHNVRVQEKDYRDATNPEIGLFEAIDSTVNDLSPSVPSGNVGLNVQDDDMAPWINYPVEDSLCSEFFSELSGMNPNSLSTQNNIVPTDRSSAFGVKDFHNAEHEHTSKALKEGSEPSRNRTSQLFQLLQQCQSSVPSTKSRVTDFGIGGSSSSSYHGHFQKQDVVATFKPLQPSSGAGLMNFSHFSRPVSLAKANHQNVDRLRSNEKALSTANPMESTLIESTRIQRHSDLDLAKVELTSAAKPHREVVSVEQSEAICQGDVARNSHHNNSIANSNSTSRDRHINQQSSTFAASTALGRHETEKGPEAVVASSSVCSGNSAGDVSNDPNHKTKRKIQEGEESSYQSEDLEDESVSIKKPGTGRGTSTKRSRAAEVHNLSERRRRDRINEKMHALQELIPNCNKVDKASMLDEAIEYLKTLQLQVQMMSMGSGLCMPSMMLPPGMQHIHAPPMAHFSPMSVGMRMGMGFGYGMGMLDMNGSPGCPLIPVPPMHAPQFPCPSIPGGPTGLHGMPGSTGLQLFGIPGQGFPVSMPRAPLFSPLSGLTAKGNSMNEVSGMMANPLPVSAAAPSSSKDQQQKNINLEAIQKTSPNKSQVVSEPFKQSQLLGMSNQALHVSGNGAFKSINNTGNASTNTTSCG